MNNPDDKTSAQPLYNLISKIRRPLTLRELIAACLRNIYMGDPFTREDGALPKLPRDLIDDVLLTEVLVAGARCAIYSPKNIKGNLPLMLYMHGGGFPPLLLLAQMIHY